LLLPSAEAAQQPGDESQLPSLPSHISTFGDDGRDELQQEDSSGEADAAAGRPSLEQQQQRSVRFDDEGAGAAVLDAIRAAPQLPSHISAFGDDLGSNEQGGCAALAGSDELEQEAPASESIRCNLPVRVLASALAFMVMLLSSVMCSAASLLASTPVLVLSLALLSYAHGNQACDLLTEFMWCCLFCYCRWSWAAVWPAGCRLRPPPHARLQLLT
jgi:hypothetical protein